MERVGKAGSELGPAHGEFSGYSEFFLLPCPALCELCSGDHRPEHPDRWDLADG